MKILCIRYPRNAVTDFLLSLLCLFIIVLILQNGEQIEAVNADHTYGFVVDYLESYGWQIDPEEISESCIILPDNNLDSMKDFFELQLQQGFDITDYVGKEIKRYDVRILNYPDKTADGVYASVFVYKNKIIAADIHSVSINGFMHGVDRNEFTKT